MTTTIQKHTICCVAFCLPNVVKFSVLLLWHPIKPADFSYTLSLKKSVSVYILQMCFLLLQSRHLCLIYIYD
jgi:hypothetical protein